MNKILIILALLLLCISSSAKEQGKLEREFTLFAGKYCIDCHGAKKQKGKLRLDTLEMDFSDVKNLEKWNLISESLEIGDMPPKKKKQPSAEEREAIIENIKSSLKNAHNKGVIATGERSLRQLTRVQLKNTLRDLLDINMRFDDLTKEYPSAEVHGEFDTITTENVITGHQLNSYLEIARKSLKRATANVDKKPAIQKIIYPMGKKYLSGTISNNPMTAGEGYLQLMTAINYDLHIKHKVKSNYEYVLRLKLKGFNSHKKMPKKIKNGQYQFNTESSPSLGIYITKGKRAQSTIVNHLVARIDLSSNKMIEIEQRFFLPEGYDLAVRYESAPRGIQTQKLLTSLGYKEQYLGSRNTIDFFTKNGTYKGESIEGKSKKEIQGIFERSRERSLGFLDKKAEELNLPRLQLYEVKVEGPIFDAWPPAKHTNLYGKEKDDKALIVKRFAEKAFRRPLEEGECDSYLKLLDDYKDEGLTMALQSILCSSPFLYLYENSGKLNDYALASRLSYALWASMPDKELLDIAKSGTLSDRKVLISQIDRMLKDKKSSSITDDFMYQWLKLSHIEKMPPDEKKFRAFYKSKLGEAMLAESKAFFKNLLDNNISVSHLINSDYTFANANLAKFYGIDAKGLGLQTQKVSLKGVPHRGGLLGQGAVLTASANGVDTSPIIRGIWVLETIFNAAPPPPPEGIDTTPDVRKAVTVREKLELHRSDPSCYRCHSKIDPLGLALENYNAIGQWRTQYQDKLKVDPAGEYKGIKFDNVEGLKKGLEKHPDLIAKSLISKFLSYATGREMEPKDKIEIEEIVEGLKDKNYRMRDLFYAALTSRIFLER